MTRKNELDAVAINIGVALTRDHENYAFSERAMSYDNCKYYRLYTRMIKDSELSLMRAGNINRLHGTMKRIGKAHPYGIAFYWFALGSLSLLMNARIPDIWNISSVPCFLLAGFFILPNFFCATELIFDIYVHFSNDRDYYFKSNYRFNAAVNMVLNAYRDLGRIPSLEEAKRYKIIDDRKKKLTNYYLGFTYIGMFFVLFVFAFLGEPTDESYAYLVFAILVVFVITAIPFLMGKLNFLEQYTLKTPTDEDVELVINAIKVLDVFEEKGDREALFYSDAINDEANEKSTHMYKDLA